MPVRRHKKQTDVSGVTAGVANLAVQQPQTAEWVEYKDPQNRPYYYNVVTKETSWVKPQALVVQPPPAQAETSTQSSHVAHTTQAQTAQPSHQLPSNQGMGMGSANQGMVGPANPLSSDLTKSSDPADDIWGKKDKDANKPDEGFWSLSVQERVTNCLRGGVTAEMENMGRNGGGEFGGREFSEGEPMHDEIGGNKVVCSLKIGEKGGAGIRFIYARIGWWVYAVNPDPGQPDIKPKDLIVGMNGKTLYTCKNQDEQVAIVKENFKADAQVEVRRGLELPPGHMDDNGKWIPAEINPYTGEPRGPMKAIDGLGMRECTKYLHVSNMTKKTHWVALRKFIKEVSGCETERTEILRRALGKKKSESRGEALVQMKTVDDALKVIKVAQGSDIDGNQIVIDFTFKKPSHSSGGYQTGISYNKGNGRYNASRGSAQAEAMCRNDAEKIALHDAVAQAILDKLRSNNGLLTQHWVGKHLNRVFGCGIIRKLVFMEPLDFYDSRTEFHALLDTMNLGANNQVQAFKVQIADGFEGDMRNRRSEGRQVWGKDGPRRDDRGGGGGRFGGGGRSGGGGRFGGGGRSGGGGRFDGNLMSEIGGPNKFPNRNAGQGNRPGPAPRGNRQVQGYGGAAVDLE